MEREMLYQERVLGRRGFWIRLLARLSRGKHADLDLLSMNPHLRRDLGIEDGEAGIRIR
jgi:hypothetical protein